MFTEAEDSDYEVRFENMVKAFASGKTTTDYDTEIFFGESLVAKPLPRDQAQGLSIEHIEGLTNYAANDNSDIYLIAQNGRVVSESYFKDINAKTLMDVKSLAKPLGVVAVGRAIKLGFTKSLD